MKTWWNILIWMWIGVIHRAEHVNGEFLLTSSPLIPTDGYLFTLTCRICDESTVNIGWLQNNKPKVVTQHTPDCSKQALAYGQDIINRINVSCSTTAHSMTFRFSSTTDQGAAWQCGEQVSDYDIHPRSNIYTIDVASSVMSLQSLSSKPETVTAKKDVGCPVVSTQSLSTTTRSIDTTSNHETVTPMKGLSSYAMSTQSLAATTRSKATILNPETVTPMKGFSTSAMSTQSLAATTRSKATILNPETVTPRKDLTSSVMSTQSLPTTTRSMAISSDPEVVTPTKDDASSVMSTKSLSTTTRSMEITSYPETVAQTKDVSSSGMSTQSSPTATQSLATTSTPETVTPTKDDSNSDTLYIVVGVVAGVVLLIIVVVVIGCILWRRKAAHQHYDLKEGINVKSTPFSQNTSSNTATFVSRKQQ